MCQTHQLWRFPCSMSELLPASRLSLHAGGGAAAGGGDEGRGGGGGGGLMSQEEWAQLREVVEAHHARPVEAHECGSLVVQRVDAPLEAVWALVRQFDQPQAYKRFIRSCSMLQQQGGRGRQPGPGSTRVVRLVSGLPAGTSTERLEVLDDERHVIGFRVLDGDHRLRNYRSLTTLHVAGSGSNASPSGATIVVESYVVDVPPGNTRDETRLFADTIVKCNLQSLARVARLQGTRS